MNIEQAIYKLEKWIDKQKYMGYDPYDGLNSYLSVFTFKNKYLRYILMQGVRLFPINIRPLIGIKKEINPKGMAILALAYLNLFKIKKDKKYLEKTEKCLDWLTNNYNKKYSGYCWGYNFDWENRIFFLPKGEPCVVVTIFCANAFMEAYKITKNKKYLKILNSITNFILKDLHMYKGKDGICISYTPYDKEKIYNASILAGIFLLKMSIIEENSKYKYIAKEIVRFVCNNQNKDGSWYYGKNKKFIDNFHTGYILDSLYEYYKITGYKTYKKNLDKGLKYYKENLFLDYIPKYYNHSVFPIDIHSIAQAIITLSKFNNILAKKVINFSIREFQTKEGYFIYRKYRYYKIKIPYFRWGQTWMLLALTEAYKNEK